MRVDRQAGPGALESWVLSGPDAEVRLLQTVASAMGVALQSAQRFDETQRLLKETEQRNAELAVINSIQQGISGNLDFQGIVELVGDTLCRVLGSQDIGIRWFDHERHRVQHLYEIEHGQRFEVPDRARLLKSTISLCPTCLAHVPAALFSLGVFGLLTRRQAVAILLSVELMANAANLCFVAFSRFRGGVTGQALAVFSLALTVAEVAASISATFRNCSLGVPVIWLTSSGVYRA